MSTGMKKTVEELRRLLDLATPGEWEARCEGEIRTADIDGNTVAIVCDDEALCDDNALYIAAAHNALPGLLDEVERLREEREAHWTSVSAGADAIKRLTAENAALRERVFECDSWVEELKAERDALRKWKDEARSTLEEAVREMSEDQPYAKCNILEDPVLFDRLRALAENDDHEQD